jgi:hypothetical protein
MSTDVSEVHAASITRAIMEAARISETSVDICLTTRQYIPDDSELHTRHRENLISHKKSCPTTRHEGAWGKRRYSSYSFSTSALDEGEWSASPPGRALAPVPTVQEAGWVPEPVWTQRLEEKFF